jgi:flagellar hook-associated protein 2
LETKAGGAMTVNGTKLASALSTNLSEVKKFFSNSDLADGSKNGFAVGVRDLANNLLSTDGAITTRTEGLNSTVKLNDKRMEQLETKAALYEKRLRAQYTALDQSMAGITTQSNLVMQMISTLNKSND